MKAIINPLEGIVIEDNLSAVTPHAAQGIEIKLGMSKDEVAGILGRAEGENGNRHFYFDSELAIDYDERNTVEFIEFLGGISGTLQPVIYGAAALRVTRASCLTF